MREQQLWTKSYIRMCLSSFFQYLNHYILIAALPIYVIQTLHQNENQAGLVLTFFQIGAVLFRPFAGSWIDNYEKKRVLFFSLALYCAVCFSYLGVQTIYFLFALRFAHGAGFSVGTTATATMAALFSPRSRKGEGVGYLAVFTSIAMVIGPFIGLALITAYSFSLLFAVCAGFGILALLCGNMRSLPIQPEEAQTSSAKTVFRSSLFEPRALPIALCGGILAIVYGGLLAYLPLYAKSIGLMDMASYFFAVYAIVIIASRPFIGRAFDRIGAAIVIYPAVAAYCAGMVLLSQASSSGAFLLAAGVIGLGFGGLNPSFQTLAVLAAPKEKSGLATSTYFLSLDIGVGVGSFVCGLLADFIGYRTMYLACSGLVLLIALLFYIITSGGDRRPYTSNGQSGALEHLSHRANNGKIKQRTIHR